LLARYDLAQVAAAVSPSAISARRPDLWRYHELLPAGSAERIVSLGEGMTPLLTLPRIGRELGVPLLLMKDEGQIPTGTFKARGAAVGVSRAAELGVTGVAMPTNGNAGAAWAMYAARAGLRSLIAMPVAAPQVTRAECAAAGAELYLVDGHIGDAASVISDALPRRPGYQDVSTLKEPYRVEGKKTMGLEIAEQLRWRAPDVIVYPAGGGVGLIGIYKAMLELRELGWVGGELPRLVAVQASGCAPIVAAFERGARHCEVWQDPSTVAFGLTVPKPLGDFLILDALYATGGTAVAIDDSKLLADQREVARLEGCFICPEGAACFSAIRRLREQGWLTGSEQVVVLNTGTGLKYPAAAAGSALVPGPSLPRDEPAISVRAMDDPYELARFVVAQDAGDTYPRAIAELRAGRKTSHWMWFVFPQIAGLGHSQTAVRYAIGSVDEARAYLRHPVLGPRLAECARMLTGLQGRTADQIFGGIDAMKLRSSMTLFHRADPDERLFSQVLEQYFAGQPDPATDSRLKL
jgi:threonine synthase